MLCPDCKHNNPQRIATCENCGADLYDILMDSLKTKQLSRMQTRELSLDEPISSRPVLLYINQSKEPVGVERMDGLIVGRADPANPAMALDIDLTDHEGQLQGVSRQHAQLNCASKPAQIVDLRSYNGTYVNDERLLPFVPRALDSGDEIKLGRLVIHIYVK